MADEWLRNIERQFAAGEISLDTYARIKARTGTQLVIQIIECDKPSLKYACVTYDGKRKFLESYGVRDFILIGEMVQGGWVNKYHKIIRNSEDIKQGVKMYRIGEFY